MRRKEDISQQVWSNIKKAPKEGRPMLEHEYCFIEVMLDTRDILNECYKELVWLIKESQ